MKKKTIFGYARISTTKQKLERQIDNIKREYPKAVVITEEYTGTTSNRPRRNKLIEQIKKEVAKGNDVTLVFDEVSRMSRNSKDGFENYKMLYDMGVNLVFLKEHHIDTDNFRQTLQSKITMTGTDVDVILAAVNEYMMKLAERQIKIAFQTAQAEVDYLHQRTSEGVKKAQAAGKQVGRAKGSKIETKKSIEAKKLIEKHSRNFNGTLSDVECMKLIGIARNSFYKYKRQLIETKEEWQLIRVDSKMVMLPCMATHHFYHRPLWSVMDCLMLPWYIFCAWALYYYSHYRFSVTTNKCHFIRIK